MITPFLRKTFQIYSSWRWQLLVYLSAFVVTVALALLLEEKGNLPLEIILLSTVFTAVVLLLVLPTTVAAFRCFLPRKEIGKHRHPQKHKRA